MLKVILDTNFCLIPFQFKVDIFSEFERIFDEEYRIMIPFVCIEELRTKKMGIAAIDLIENHNVLVVDIARTKTVDDTVLALALKEHALIATQDAELKRKAKKAGIHIVTLRKEQHLALE
jgi:rRNA-processing protein FCF1